MPLYDTKCLVCERVQVDVFFRMAETPPLCACGGDTERLVGKPSAVHIFDSEQVFEHLADEPLKFRSRRELRRYCREHDLGMDYAE